jgi:hypothetical protein
MIQHQNPEKMLAKSLSSLFYALDKDDLKPEMFVALFLQTHEAYLPLGTQHDSD